PIVAADHLDADAKPVEVVNRALRVRLGWVVEHEKAAERHILLVVTTVALLGADLPGRHLQNTAAFGPFPLEALLQLRAVLSIQWHIDAAELKRRAVVEHVRECALG